MILYKYIYNINIFFILLIPTFFAYPTGGGGLEVRCHGIGSYVSVDLRDRLRGRHCANYLAGVSWSTLCVYWQSGGRVNLYTVSKYRLKVS